MITLLVTGAGASRNLGDNALMPLMSNWSDALCEALDNHEPGLASSCGLQRGMEGVEFEENLGLLLRWQQVRHLEEIFQNLGGDQAGSHLQCVEEARHNSDARLRVVMETVNTTLYEQFGQRRVNDERARIAYRNLLNELREPELIVATTNYDRTAESALTSLGFEVDTGFRGRAPRTPTLEPTGIVAERGKKVPVLHLHGAVGWYERNGSVSDWYADQPYNPSLGTPVVLYPDPEKDPTSDALVSELWAEFDMALEVADSVLVIGHSLHDPALVRALKRTAKAKPVVISFFVKDSEKIRVTVPRAMPLGLDFGPEIQMEQSIRAMLKRIHRPVRAGHPAFMR